VCDECVIVNARHTNAKAAITVTWGVQWWM